MYWLHFGCDLYNNIINLLKELKSRKKPEYMMNYSLPLNYR